MGVAMVAVAALQPSFRNKQVWGGRRTANGAFDVRRGARARGAGAAVQGNSGVMPFVVCRG